MQTFLPIDSFRESAAVLDRQRCGKQRVEAMQLLQVLLGEKSGWANHPAAKMWKGHEAGLAGYALAVCEDWTERRGYRDTCAAKIRALCSKHGIEPGTESDAPEWFGRVEFHRAHRSNLLRKKPEFYAPLFEADLPDDLPYEWPV